LALRPLAYVGLSAIVNRVPAQQFVSLFPGFGVLLEFPYAVKQVVLLGGVHGLF
jgi:hypothetical protein